MEVIRKKSFSIALKLSLLIAVIILISFFFVFAFYINSVKYDFIERIDSEISIKIDTLKQDIINFSLGIEEGDFRLSILEDKIISLYKSSQDKLAVFDSIKFINKNSLIIVDSDPKNKLKYFFDVEKKYGKEHYNYIINFWSNIKTSPLLDYQKDFTTINKKSIYQIFLPVYYFLGANENFRLNLFSEFYRMYQKENILTKIKVDNFFLNSFYIFTTLNNYSHLYEDEKPTTYGNSIISESKEYYQTVIRLNRKTRGFVPPFYPITLSDIKTISIAVNGLQYFFKTYWYTRIKSGKNIIKAIENIKILTDKKIINQILNDIIEEIKLLNEEKASFEDIKPKITIKIKKLEEIYNKNIYPFKDILTEREENLSTYIESMLNFLEYLEANLKSVDKVIARIKNFDNNIKNLSERTIKLFNNYLSVSVKEQDYYALNKSILIKGLDAIYKIKIFEAYKDNSNNFDENKKKIEEEIKYLKELILNNNAIYRNIQITDENIENTLTLKDYNSMISYFFLIYINDFIKVFKTSDTLKERIKSILSNPIPSVYKTFSENDINKLDEKIKEINNLILNFRENYNKGLISESLININNNSIEELFNLLFNRYHIGYLLVRISQDKLEEALNQRINSLIDLFLNLLIRFIFLGVILSLLFLNRFKKINEGIKAIGEGNLNYKILIKGNDEIGQLADHLNIMAEHLKEKTRMESELNAARLIQETLLPKEYPTFESLKFASYYSAQVETGGDYFDFIKIDEDNLAIVIADVSGHGVGACLVMSMIRTIIRTYASSLLDPKKMLLVINDYIFKNTPSNMYATILYGIVNSSGELIYSVAGHNPSIVFSPDKKEIKILETGGMVCGLVDRKIFENTIKNYSFKLEKNNIFIQYTDGVTEAENLNREQYGFERLKETIVKYNGNNINELFKMIIDDVNLFTGGIVQSDDITMMGIQFLGKTK
ncbi:MAG TPA: SpoIIE family protein phosphatase [Spirochaetota bacterium]|nr:SpoIIE family protein phosphatase [Spirochaetota bacterium]HOM37670.1 SpoIIE family protein phosphatase [Spirochaetota bacterium]HPQ49628.1 SpoIIE family protein phosphatase [Spirochaetota bacterium]